MTVTLNGVTLSGADCHWSPASVPGLQLWLDAADSSTVTSDGNGVSQWNDKSANGFNVTQSTASAKPSYQSAVQNGRNIVRFDGGDNLVNTSAKLLRSVTGASGFVVAARAGSAYGVVFTIPTANDTDRLSMGVSTVASGIARRITSDNYKDVYSTVSPSVNAFYQSSFVRDYSARNGSIWLNGSNKQTTTSWGTSGATANDSGELRVGATYYTASLNLSGDIGEIIVYNTALPDAARIRIEAYLMHKWGI